MILNILSGMMVILPHYCRSSYDIGSVQVTKIAGGLRVTVGSSTMECDLHELIDVLEKFLVAVANWNPTTGDVNTHHTWVQINVFL